jgi:hypothetical protein
MSAVAPSFAANPRGRPEVPPSRPAVRGARGPGANPLMISISDKNFSVGKYLVSPMTRLTGEGDYAASLSIRSGRGSGTHDRVFRFVPRFATPEGARTYAIEQGVSWLQRHSRP